MTLLRRLTLGLMSLLALAALVVGVPWALLLTGNNPFTGGVPAWSDILTILTTRDNGAFILTLFTVVAWAGWAILMAALVVEILARLRRAQAPQLPGLRLPQLAARNLISGVLLLFLATPGLAHAAPSTPVPAPAQTLTSSYAQATEAATPARAADALDTTEETVVVKKGDSLSKIAASELGDGNRWPDLFEASKHTDQGDGARLTNPNLIHPGWTISIPAATAAGQATPSTRAEADQHAPAEVTAPEQPDGPGTATPQDPPASPEQRPVPPDAVTAAPSTGATTSAHTPSVQEHVQQVQDEAEDPIPVRTNFGVGALMAAGVVSMLGVRRTMQHRRRAFGNHIALPTGADAAVEQAVRAVADPLALEDVDQALRALSRDCAVAGEPLPALRAARLTPAQFELYLAEPRQLPSPWQGTADSTVWFFEPETAERLSESDLQDIPAPYPALVTLGQDAEDGHVLVDLEYLGALALVGAPETSREILAAIAIELAVSRWADDITVTIVGSHSEMEDSLRTGRLRYLPNVERLIDALEVRGQQDRAALAEGAVGSLQEARVRGVAPDAWTPEIVMIAGDLTTRQRNRIANLIDATPRPAIAIVTATGEPLTEWSLESHDADSAVLRPFGLTITPQRITHEAYERILSVMALTQNTHGTPMTSQPDAVEEPDVVELGDGDAPAAGLDEARPAAVTVALSDGANQQHPYLRVLGPVVLENARGTVDPRRTGRLTEYLAFLLLNRGATYPAIDEAMWPGRPAAKDANNHNTRGTATSRLRRWLGKDAADEDYFPPYSGYRISNDVRTDWSELTHLVGDSAAAAHTKDLEQALSLVRGRPFKGVPVRRYAWAEMIRQRMIAQISDASYELGHRRLFQGDWQGVEQAVTVGIEVDPGTERLWRLRILAAHQSGNQEAFREAVDRMEAFGDELGLGLDPETEDLLRALDSAAPFDALVKNLDAHPLERTQ